jgi:hypothetical protein
VRIAGYDTCGHGRLPSTHECVDTIGRDCAHDAFADAGYADALDLAPPRRRQDTEYASFNGGKTPLPQGDKIDHVYVRAGTAVRRWTLVPQTTAQSGPAWDLLRSDHNLMHTTVRPAVTR